MTNGIEIRDSEWNRRRIGPPSSIISTDNDDSSGEDKGRDVALVRIAPNEPCRQSYTSSAKPKVDGLRSTDTRNPNRECHTGDLSNDELQRDVRDDMGHDDESERRLYSGRMSMLSRCMPKAFRKCS